MVNANGFLISISRLFKNLQEKSVRRPAPKKLNHTFILLIFKNKFIGAKLLIRVLQMLAANEKGSNNSLTDPKEFMSNDW